MEKFRWTASMQWKTLQINNLFQSKFYSIWQPVQAMIEAESVSGGKYGKESSLTLTFKMKTAICSALASELRSDKGF